MIDMSKQEWDIMKVTCVHVLDKTAPPEYMVEDDSYVCSNCRDMMQKKSDIVKVKPSLKIVHRSRLTQIGIEVKKRQILREYLWDLRYKILRF